MIAMDPSGASDRILVTVNVTDVDDPAQIIGFAWIRFAENGTTPVGIFRALAVRVGAPSRGPLAVPTQTGSPSAGGVLRFR